MVSGLNSNYTQDWKAAANSAKLPGINENTIKSAGTIGAISAAEDSDSFSTSLKFGAASAAVFEGIPLGLYLKRNHKLGGEMTEAMKNLSANTQNAFKNLIHGEGKLTERISNYFNVINTNKSAYHNIKDITKAKSNLQENVVKASTRAAKALESPNILRNWLSKRADKTLSKNIQKASKPIMEGAAAKKGITGLLKTSGAGILMAFGGIIEGVTEIYPTFSELGAEKGFKQLGKSAVKVAGDTAGFIIGDQIGMAVGSAIGTALFPGVGTAIGAVTGLVVGMLGSHAASGITDKIVGKSERELAKEQQNPNKDNILSLAA